MPANDTFEVVDGRDDLPIQIYYGLDRPELTLHEFRVYIHLVRRASGTGRAWPSYKSIGEYCFRTSYPNSDQDISVPEDAQPLSELLGQLPVGADSLGGLAPSTGGDSSGGSGGSDAYYQCVQQAPTPDAVNDCSRYLQ